MVPPPVVHNAPRITFIGVAAFHLKMRIPGARFSYALDFGKLPIGPALSFRRNIEGIVIQSTSDVRFPAARQKMRAPITDQVV